MKTGKLIGNTGSGVNQIRPHMNKWAWELYLKALGNNWTPDTVPMSKDIEQWNSKTDLTDEERLLLVRCLGFFAGSESLVSNNLLMVVYNYITDPECRQYILRQAFEEALHNHTVVYVCDSLGLDEKEVYEAYANIPSIKAKDDFLVALTNKVSDPDFKPVGDEGIKEILKALIVYYLVCEGTFFYSGFAMLLNFAKRGKMPGLSAQVGYTIKDECLSEDTELLTPTGWKSVIELTTEDLVAQFDNDRNISFVHPKKISKNYIEKSITYSNNHHTVDMRVSPNHRVIYEDKRAGRIKEKLAKDLKFQSYMNLLVAGSKVGTRGLSPMDRFKIALQADGTIPKRDYNAGVNTGHILCSFNLTKDRKKKRLLEVVKNCGLEIYSEREGDSGTIFSVRVPLEHATKDFSDWVNLTDVSKEYCVDFIEEASHWDGHIVKDRITYCSTDKPNIDIVQAIAALADYKTNIITSEDDRKESYKTYYRLNILKNRNYATGSVIERKEEDFNDFMYGVEVDSGMIMARRNGCVSITGNSLHVEFGTRLINEVIKQNPQIWTEEFKEEVIDYITKTVELESAYADDVLPNGVLGLRADMFYGYVQYIANRRLTSIGLREVYKGARNPFPWMTEIIDLPSQSNFFERTVTNYAVGQLKDDF